MTINSSPAFGTSDNPMISAGIDGVACLIFLPFSTSHYYLPGLDATFFIHKVKVENGKNSKIENSINIFFVILPLQQFQTSLNAHSYLGKKTGGQYLAY